MIFSIVPILYSSENVFIDIAGIKNKKRIDEILKKTSILAYELFKILNSLKSDHKIKLLITRNTPIII
jgi:hypothetical protein